MPSEDAIRQIWIWSLAVYFVVVGVVALMLTLILRAVREIHAGVAAIWATGQQVANNTIQIPLLARTNAVVQEILASAGRTAAAVEAIAAHADTCPGCPACVLKPGRGGR